MSVEPIPGNDGRARHRAAPMSARRRGPGEVLLERSDARGLVVSGLSEAETGAVLALGPGIAGIERASRRKQTPSRRWADVLTVVREAAEQLAPPPQSAGHFVVAGVGQVADQIAGVLTQIGQHLTDDPAAVAALEHDPSAGGRRPDLVVLPTADALPPLATRSWQRHGIAHLPVAFSGDRLMVGPLLRPDSGPCGRCLDLHRSDHDPGWAHWLAGRGALDRWDQPVHADPELAAVAAGLVGLVARGVLRRQPLPTGVSLSVVAPRPRVQHHVWTRHPACCGRVTQG